jgi:carotenoid cleavage dioxygenase-like enzyme
MLTVETLAARQFEHDAVDTPRRPVSAIDGHLPPLAPGTWFFNGPAGFHAAGLDYRHWLDGDGMVRAVTFATSGVSYASRFVRTRKYLAEHAAGRRLFRTFGTAFQGDRLNERGTGLEGAANINVVRHAGRLLALGEQGEPWAIDTDTLDTRGPFTADGTITPVTPFSAHPKIDAATSELFNFGISFSTDRPQLHLFRWNARGELLYRTRARLHCASSVHDFALGPTVAAFYISPYTLDVGALRAGACVLDALEWRPEHDSRLLVMSRDTGRELASIRIGHQYCLHTIGCREAGHRLMVDVIEMPAPIYTAYAVPQLFEPPLDARPVRLVIDVSAGRLLAREEMICDNAPEFPARDPNERPGGEHAFWALGISDARQRGAKFFDEVLRFDWNAGGVVDGSRAPAGCVFGGEPIIVTDRMDERRRWLCCELFDAVKRKSGAAIFDADALASGPVARLWWPLARALPTGFHGTYIVRDRAA